MTMIGNWRVLESIGNGGNATVFKVTDNDGNYFALKRLNTVDEEKRARFNRESSFIGDYPILSQKQLLLPIIDKDLTCEHPYYVMPLAIPLKKITFDSLQSKCNAIIDVLEMLSQLHKLGIAHRDIKPENILAYNNRFYLSDFGLMFIRDAERITKEADRERIGAKRTIAPEMERKAGYDADPYKADIYSMAKTIWMILTEDYDCFEGQYDSNSSISLDRYDKIGSFDDGLIPSAPYFTPLDLLLTQCTDHDPNIRPSIDVVIKRFNFWIDINHNYHLRNNYEWYEITDKLFPVKTPNKVVWTDLNDIISVLNFLCKYKCLAYVFLPRGGAHYKGVRKAEEERFLEFDMGMAYLFPAKSLTFYSFGKETEWNYFRLDAYDDVEPVFLKELPEEITEADEELTELFPGVYAPLEVWEYDEEYHGYCPTENMRRIARYYRGSFVLFNTRSSYNLESSTHNRHSHFTKEEFEFYIQGCSQGRYDLRDNEGIYAVVKAEYSEKMK